ncbi:MAG: hypothetical protein MK089_08295 [Phycisphaerales bacterium]|nr:hypothetical protein [Phycisphaerales bacterium]
MMKVNSILALITVLLLQACDGQIEQTRDGGIKTTATRGPVEVTVTATPGQVEVGKPLKLEIEAITANDVHISMPMITPNANGTIGNFHVLTETSREDLPLPAGMSGRSWNQTLLLDTFEAGDTTIPGLSIVFKDNRAELPIEGSVNTDALTIEVISLIGAVTAESGLREIRGPVEMIDPWPLWIWASIGIGTLLLLAVITLVMRGRGLEEIPQLSPEDQARRDLDALAHSGLLQEADMQRFYVRLTDILRHYIEGRFGLKAPKATTPEFLTAMSQGDLLTLAQQQSLDQFLRSADMVKFARHEPSIETGEAALQQARSFVEETAPREEQSLTERSAA